MQKLKKTRRKQKTNRNKQKINETTRRKTENNRNTGFPAHEPPRKINISKGLAGRFLLFVCFFLFLFLCSFEFSFYVCSVFIYVFVDCKCKSLKSLGENITNKTERNRKTIEKLKGKQNNTEIQDFQPTNLRE